MTASVKAWGALRMRFGFQMKAMPGMVEFKLPRSLWELTWPVPFNSASPATDP
ncbi:hypothetical protein HZB78_04965 [Candidatus Collierbacteria bacterium]|nr:hypothetical protein [Candidatus Collierbacteria bacterium]